MLRLASCQHYRICTPEEYRAKWHLPPDCPMVAPYHAASRSEMAKRIGLGRQPKPLAAPIPRRLPDWLADAAGAIAWADYTRIENSRLSRARQNRARRRHTPSGRAGARHDAQLASFDRMMNSATGRPFSGTKYTGPANRPIGSKGSPVTGETDGGG